MSVGRFILRGWAFQGRIYAPWALGGGGGAAPVLPPEHGVAVEHRSNVATLSVRSRVATVLHRGQIIEGGKWR
jgi:hypothetical protein